MSSGNLRRSLRQNRRSELHRRHPLLQRVRARHTSDEMIQFGDTMVCANCKDSFAQKLREGVTPGQTYHYGGFWIRFAARVIDGVLLWIILLWHDHVAIFTSMGFARSGNFAGVSLGVFPVRNSSAPPCTKS